MTVINWKVLEEYRIDNPRQITAPWITVIETLLREASYLRITAEGRWTPTGGVLGECGPDGLLGPQVQTKQLAVPDCPVGALIGKFGGSSAALTPVPADAAQQASGQAPATPPPLAEGQAFAIGACCIVPVPAKSIGPLYVSFNGLIRPVDVAELRITVSGATPTM